MTSVPDHSPSAFPASPASIDPISLEILWQRMISIMDEVDQIIVRTTFSTILRESRDFACILTDAHGSSLCQSVLSTANFAAVHPRTAKMLLNRFPPIELWPGDMVDLCIAGGGGFGPVEKRADHQILRDLAFGYITPQSVAKDYGIDGCAGNPR